jgi:hypothetical protein
VQIHGVSGRDPAVPLLSTSAVLALDQPRAVDRLPGVSKRITSSSKAQCSIPAFIGFKSLRSFCKSVRTPNNGWDGGNVSAAASLDGRPADAAC